jgi:prophage DNA circulation protein
MPDWKDNLRQASFRGQPFYTETHGGESGRRWADHQYPGRDVPYAEDLGRAQRTWRFAGYLIGDDYPMRRNALVAACEAAGAGELVHPTIGTVKAVCRSVAHSEARDRGRYVTLQFEFAEAGQLREPSALADVVAEVTAAAEQLGGAASAGLTRSHSTAGGGAFLTQSSVTQIATLASQLQTARLPAPGVDQGALNKALRDLVENAPALSADAAALAAAVDSVFTEFTNAGEALPVVSSMLMLAAPGVSFSWLPGEQLLRLEVLPPPPAPALRGPITGTATYRLPVIEQRRINTLSFDTFARCLELREVGYSVPGLPLDNYDEAILLLDHIGQAFLAVEQIAAAAGEDDIYQGLASLRAEITRLIRQRAINLTPLIRYRLYGDSGANSLTFAWRMYQDSGRDLEVVERTKTRTPAYLPFTGRVLAA